MPRPPRPDDLYRLRIPTDPRLSPDGRLVSFTLETVVPTKDGYRHAVWAAPTDGSAPPRQLTLGARHDRGARFSPDSRTLAFLSDRRLLVEEEPDAPKDPKEREDGVQVHLLPVAGGELGGEARRLTDLPRGVDSFEWSPDGRWLAVLSSSRGATRKKDARLRGKAGERKPTQPPRSDYHYLDRLDYMLNGAGFTYHRRPQLWIVEVATGTARRLTEWDVAVETPAWSPDGRRIVVSANRRPDHDLLYRPDIWAVDVESGRATRLTGGPGIFSSPAWLPEGGAIACLGTRLPAGGGSRNDIWLFAADGSEAGPTGGRNLSAPHDLMPGSGMASDLTRGEAPRLVASADGRWLTFSAPVGGSYELWRIAMADGSLERLTEGRHYISGWDEVGGRPAYLRSSPSQLPDIWAGTGSGRRLTELNGEVLAEIEFVEPVERWWRSDGQDVQGWHLPPAGTSRGSAPAPLVTEIHGGPHTLYGWSPFWEFQLLAAAGIGVFYANPRGSEGYGEAFNAANFADWGEGPARDVLSGLETLVAEGLADPGRLGLTGGSYGGYLTTWIVGHDLRFRAAITCRSVADMSVLMLTGDISGVDWARLEFGAAPWEDPELYRRLSPLTYAGSIRTPLLIQHAEEDLRTTVGQAEALFAVLRSLRRPVRFMRVPKENHELTRSGTPFRRMENLVQVRDWFVHYLVKGAKRLPPLPRERAGK